jgi:hypothetical protein
VSHERASDPRSQVVITRFECHGLARVLLVLAMHVRIKKEVRRVAKDFLGGTTVVLWRERVVLSITLWRRLDGVYDMGGSNRHIVASRRPAKLGISTACGIYTYAGDWRHLMFGTAATAGEPLRPIADDLVQKERSKS